MWMVIIVLLSITTSYSQIKNAVTESVKIYGNCEMCKATIEKAGNVKNSAKVDWNEETKMASITYNSKLTNKNAILKRIALSGYDSDSFLAPDLAYSKLMDCCKYERKSKIMPVSNVVLAEAQKVEMQKENEHAGHNMPMEAKVETSKADEHAGHKMPSESKVEEKISTPTQKEVSPIQAVFNNYFALKETLVNTNGTAASLKADDLLKSIAAIKMNELNNDLHIVWMKVVKDLAFDSEHIAETKETDHQRDHFMRLSKNMYELMKVEKSGSPTYYQFCPMANGGKGANWLSKENEVKNPYYGSEMMTCGKTIETIK